IQPLLHFCSAQSTESLREQGYMPNPKSWRNWDEKIASNWPESCGSVLRATDLCGGRLLPEAISDPNTDQPEDHQGQRRERRNEEKRRAVHPHRHHLLLPEEERTGGEEQRETHPPEMSCDALHAGNAALEDDLEIQSREQRRDDGEHVVEWRAISLQLAAVHRGLRAPGQEQRRYAQWDKNS